MRPERVAGMHFFNPVPLMKLVEVIDGVRTAPHVAGVLMDLGKRMARTPVHVKDAPGFLVNQVGRGYNIECAHIASDGVAGYADIDRICRDAVGFRMGPFELMDLTAVDVTHPATNLIYEQFYHEPRFRPATLMQMQLDAGLLGRKVGNGFYVYEDGKAQIAEEAPAPDFDGRPVWISKVEPATIRRDVTARATSISISEKPAVLLMARPCAQVFGGSPIAGLSLRRMAFIHTSMAKIYQRDNSESRVVAVAEKNALLKLESCPKNWCRVTTETVRGWVQRAAIWGVLKDESLK